MQLFHTSPQEIKEISRFGTFGDCLFFSSSEYQMSQAANVVYRIDLNEDQVVPVYKLYDADIVAEIADRLSIDTDDAERVLDGRDTAFDYDGEGEDDWWVQAKQGECAKKMGFLACESEDEQGSVWIIPMSGKIEMLEKI